jgi:hypothetical protein
MRYLNDGKCGNISPTVAGPLFAAMLLFAAGCGGETEAAVTAKPAAPAAKSSGTVDAGGIDTAALFQSLEQFAEAERSGIYMQGMGLAESGLRENAGDYSGAVAAAYKELARAYGYGLVQKEALEQGLGNVLALEEDKGRETAVQTAGGILAFAQEQWDKAQGILLPLFDEYEEPDGFGRWMILACALEKDHGDRRTGEAYRAIQARYTQFPEYWYRGARAFSGTIAAEYAERCVSLAPSGPFAAECRNILAAFSGLKPGDGASLKSKSEIEALISQSVRQGEPELLSPLIPLIALPENPYTVYATGALRALASLPQFRDYFDALAEKSTGRLAERLTYICRG